MIKYNSIGLNEKEERTKNKMTNSAGKKQNFKVNKNTKNNTFSRRGNMRSR